MSTALAIAGKLGRGLDAVRELAAHPAGDWSLATQYTRRQLAPAVQLRLLDEAPRAGKNLPLANFRFQYRLTKAGREFLAALDKPAPSFVESWTKVIKATPLSLAKAPACGKTSAPAAEPARERVTLAARHEFVASESGLFILRLYGAKGELLAQYERIPEEEADDFLTDGEACFREARANYHLPAHARRG